MIQVITKSK